MVKLYKPGATLLQVVTVDFLPDPNVTRAGPAPATCTTAQEAQVAAPGHACLAAKPAKKKRTQCFEFGNASWDLQIAPLNFAFSLLNQSNVVLLTTELQCVFQAVAEFVYISMMMLNSAITANACLWEKLV